MSKLTIALVVALVVGFGVAFWLSAHSDSCREPMPELRQTMAIDRPECADAGVGP